MNDWVEIGSSPRRGGGRPGKPLHLRNHRIRSGAQTITVTVPSKPVLAGIDSYHLLDVIELENDDTIEQVKIQS